MGTVRVEVADASAARRGSGSADGDDTNGRGLELVDGLADRWGWQHEGAGKRIWCEVDGAFAGQSADAEVTGGVPALRAAELPARVGGGPPEE